MNEHRTSNIEHRTLKTGSLRTHPVPQSTTYDLEERLLNYAAGIIGLVESLPNTRAGNHIASQLLRSGTSPLSNHGEAQAGESQADFVHKLKICLKELRESLRWIRLVQRTAMLKSDGAAPLEKETEELIRIFVASIRTSEQRTLARNGARSPR